MENRAQGLIFSLRRLNFPPPFQLVYHNGRPVWKYALTRPLTPKVYQL